ncbi:hypothetical protein COCNU_08G001230 [Cocos nucifera]|uniref:Uncharacterized protein n=1 Tax=Cocos nucifera TaxID=13894 RepID=A0A8K0N696_COCNU|nr:hypothetical protein COCNU_08G001230 [Cocos nucifera]
MLKEGHKHLPGLNKAVLKNIDACKELSVITRTSLGPSASTCLTLLCCTSSIRALLESWEESCFDMLNFAMLYLINSCFAGKLGRKLVIDSMEDGGDCEEVERSEARVGACQELSISEAGDGDCDNRQELDAPRADGGDGKECPNMDGECGKVVTTEAESGLCDGPCQGSLPPTYCQDPIIADEMKLMCS